MWDSSPGHEDESGRQKNEYGVISIGNRSVQCDMHNDGNSSLEESDPLILVFGQDETLLDFPYCIA